MRLAGLLAQRGGPLDEADQILRALADADDDTAVVQRLAELADEARAPAPADDWYAAVRLAGLLGIRGHLDELRARASAGDKEAARRLGVLLGARGDLDELRARASAGDEEAARWLAGS
jgi:hypothetical protein